jgi:hypothetical protein
MEKKIEDFFKNISQKIVKKQVSVPHVISFAPLEVFH